MTIGKYIEDGQGTQKAARVKTPQISADENSLCVNISGISKDIAIPTFVASTGIVYSVFASLDGLGVTTNAAVNGSVTEQDFKILSLDDYDFFVTDLLITGSDGGIKINNFLGLASALTNGCFFGFRSNNKTLTTRTLKTTSDLAVFASKGGFDLYSEAAGDLAKTVRVFDPTPVIRATNTFTTTAALQDHIKFSVRDNLTAVTSLYVEARGFLTEPGLY